MEALRWRTEKRKIKDLVAYDRNPRQMTEKQAQDLQKSPEKFDLVEIPAIDVDNRIIAGHQRLRIMAMLGRQEEEIDVRVPNRKLTQEEFDEYNLRSNKNTGEWDFDTLANLNEDLLKDKDGIENYKQANDLNNLISLCSSCHSSIEPRRAISEACKC